ncbi:MAG: tail fiber domain-containing protein [Microcystis sp. M54BS1]|uniref:tail fiber domain-containing protein n=1 Tax=unclassified Microcystis TaxID=2643300 RepID=UPI002580E01B|nr:MULTISPECIES: tail fiber domain-containing protein [unclassified Microcystis]MCA2540059.1 tail fiber domain-containing protein [Microcystis sp. M54BS1]MCA2595849.1 tail fiber domain-containing protein [Microcystis sp. M38BS1]MCA2612373.1 tail fiber domain-containing protein [Microcystis sp. M27BS1]MCA2507758.1 tail fiber domain-containing protein [Microcystis sp. M62BS1]MCA2509125.1 tail fiber domain-containing protein [Microcystis sp. M60BS1]
MANPIKRLNYFNGQFLRAPDFTEEQTYHLEMRRRHNENLHTWGIADGLKLQYTIGSSQIEIAEGMAIDSKGREIVLVEKANKDLSGFVNKTVYVTIAYKDELVDKTNETGVEGFTRVQEIPTINISENPPSADQLSLQLILGRVTVNSEGKITATDEGEGVNRRRAAGVVAGDLEARSLTLTDTNVDPSQWSRMRLGAAGRADLQSNLKVAGNLEVTGTVDGRDVSADGTELDSHTSNTNNPHQTTAALIDNQGGTNRLVTQINASTGVINEARIDPAIARDSEVTALVNNHANNTNNPHGTTAAQVGALVSIDGVNNPGGNVDLVSSNAITLTPDNTNKRITIGETHSARTDNPHNTTAAQVGALPISGGTLTGNGSLTANTLTVVNGLTINNNIGANESLECRGRMRLRQISNSSLTAGIWCSSVNAYYGEVDTAFIGLFNENSVGFWGSTGQPGWRLLVDTTSGNLTVTGNAFKPGGGAWGISSDERLKKNISTLEGALDKLLQLRGVSYEWKEPEKQGNLTGPQMGLIAQEVEAVFPEWIGVDADGYQTLSIRGFEALVVEALKELKAENEALKKRCEELERQLAVGTL